MFENYILAPDGKDYVDVDDVRAVLGIKEYENIFRAIEEMKEERDQLKEKCDRLSDRLRTYRFIANGAYGDSCGYSTSKQPAFLCNVISYSWELAPIEARSLMDEPSYCVRNDSIRVELELTPTANYKGTFDPEDLRQYIDNYGREKKFGIYLPDDADYQNAKAARAELAYLYKQVLGKERLDTNLSPHEVMKAILDEHKRGRIERLPELVNDLIDELCDKYNVVRPLDSETTRGRLDYIFGVLAEYRDLANDNFNKAEGFRKEKRAVEDSLAETRRERDNLTVFRNDVANAVGLPYIGINSDIINRVMEIRECHEKLCKDYTELRKAIWDAMDRKPETLPDETARLVGEVRMLQMNYVPLKQLHDEVAKAIGMDRPATDNAILHNVQYIYKDRKDAYEIVSKLNDQLTDLLKAKDWAYGEYKEQYRLRQMWHVRYESEHERANGEHKRAEKLRSDVTVLKNHIELLRNANDSRANALVSLQAFKNECRKLKEEKTKVISALGQDIWDDCVK